METCLSRASLGQSSSWQLARKQPMEAAAPPRTRQPSRVPAGPGFRLHPPRPATMGAGPALRLKPGLSSDPAPHPPPSRVPVGPSFRLHPPCPPAPPPPQGAGPALWLKPGLSSDPAPHRGPALLLSTGLHSSPAPHPSPSATCMASLWGLGLRSEPSRPAGPAAHGFRPAPCLSAWVGLRSQVLHPRFFSCFSTTKHFF